MAAPQRRLAQSIRSKNNLQQVELSSTAKLLFAFDADSLDEALAIRNLRLGWQPYKPVGKATECPNNCGAWYYPESSGECPHCGPIKLR